MRVFAYKKLKAILDLETIVCLMRTLLYGEIEIHANQCHTHSQFFIENITVCLRYSPRCFAEVSAMN